MAMRIRPCLLAVAFFAADWVSGATSVPKQVHNSQKSVDCIPCSKTYVADAYLDALTGQLAQHRDLTEVPDTADLCKGLDDDLDVPALSEVHRQLVGEGSHRRLVYSVKFGNCDDCVVKFLDGYDVNLVIVEKLPCGVFADPFELQHFVERKVFLDVAVFGDTNLELPSALSNRSAVEIHFDLKPSTSMDCNLVVELPLHARYPPLDSSGYATVEFGSPDLFLRYRKKDTHPDSCIWVFKNLNATPVEKTTWRVPCGDGAHTGFVSSLTFISALVCSMSIAYAEKDASYLDSFGEPQIPAKRRRLERLDHIHAFSQPQISLFQAPRGKLPSQPKEKLLRQSKEKAAPSVSKEWEKLAIIDDDDFCTTTTSSRAVAKPPVETLRILERLETPKAKKQRASKPSSTTTASASGHGGASSIEIKKLLMPFGSSASQPPKPTFARLRRKPTG